MMRDDADFFVDFGGKLVFPPRAQRDVDAVVSAFHRGESSDEALQRLTAWLDEYGDEMVLGGYETVLHAVADPDDAEVRGDPGLTPDSEVTAAHHLSYLERHQLDGLLGRLVEDSDAAYAFAPFRAVASDEAEAVLTIDTRGYSFSGITSEWSRPCASFEEFERSLEVDGRVFGADEFRARPLDDKLRLLRGAPPDRAG